MISEGNIEVIISRLKLIGWIMKMGGFLCSAMSTGINCLPQCLDELEWLINHVLYFASLY